MAKRADTFRGLRKWCNSEFDSRFACWANNHGGWAKMKRAERKRMRKPEKARAMKEEDHERVDKGKGNDER